MLGILIPYHSCFELLDHQLQNFKTHIKTPYKVFVIDNSLTNQPPHPDVIWVISSAKGTPSERHQKSINLGLQRAWSMCDCFLLFDNDMILLEDFVVPRVCFYCPQKRGNWEYGWLNLMFFTKDELLRQFDFAVCPETKERTDSGGSFGFYLQTKKVCAQIQTLPFPDYSVFPDYQKDYVALCKTFGIGCWFDLFSLNGTRVFHFRALSNWTNYPPEFQAAKKALILFHLEKSLSKVEDGTRVS